MRALALLAATGVLVLFGAGCGSSSDGKETPGARAPALRALDGEPPGRMIERHFRNEFSGQFGPDWDDLYPAHQRLISRQRFEECFFPGTPVHMDSYRVVSVVNEPIQIPEVREKTSKAVTWAITTSLGSQSDEDTGVAHAVRVRDRWRWVLSAAALRRVKDGQCPGGSSTPSSSSAPS